MTRGCWAVLDQALFALSSLVVNIMLARWLPPAEYGAFVTAQTVLLLVGVLHTSFLSEPMLIFGAGKYRAGFSHYMAILQVYHWRLTVVVSVALLLAAAALSALGFGLLARSFVGLSLAVPVVLLGWLARRACYAVSQPGWAALAGALNLSLVIAGAAALAWSGHLTVFSAQLLLAGAALAAAGVMMPKLMRLTIAPLSDRARATVWPEHWSYGRWSGGAGALGWIQTYIYYLVLPVWGGLAATASLRALINLVMPILQSDSALITLLAPVFVRLRPDASRFRRLIGWCIGAFTVEALIYWVILLLLGDRLLDWAYGGVYRYDADVLLLLGLLPFFNSLLNVLGATLRAREEVDKVFWASTASVLVTLTLGVAAVSMSGVKGAVVAMASASAAQALVMTILLQQRRLRVAL
jgi:O-antigen/teichoic acid export membrane protein